MKIPSIPSRQNYIRGCSDKVPEKRFDVLRTSPYGLIRNVNGRFHNGMSLGRTQDVNHNP